MALDRQITFSNFAAGVGAVEYRIVLGLQVRLRERPGPLSWGTVLLRWLAWSGYNFLGFVPMLGWLTYVYPGEAHLREDGRTASARR